MCSQRTTLVLVAHLDDEALNCGGLIQKRVRQNHVVHVLRLYARKYNYVDATPEMWATQLSYARAAKKVLGYSTLMHLDLPEGDPQITGYAKTLRQIEQAVANVCPTHYLVPHSLDLNQDHRHLADVCEISLRPAVRATVQNVLLSVSSNRTRMRRWALQLRGALPEVKQLLAPHCPTKKLDVLGPRRSAWPSEG